MWKPLTSNHTHQISIIRQVVQRTPCWTPKIISPDADSSDFSHSAPNMWSPFSWATLSHQQLTMYPTISSLTRRYIVMYLKNPATLQTPDGNVAYIFYHHRSIRKYSSKTPIMNQLSPPPPNQPPSTPPSPQTPPTTSTKKTVPSTPVPSQAPPHYSFTPPFK